MAGKNGSSQDEKRKKAFVLIFLFGLVSLLGDIIYEGARSVNGPYLDTLGANAAIVGLVVGAGELLGYGVRLFSGYFSDKTKAHWFFTIFGYSLLVSVPLLSLTGVWQLAAVCIVVERIGKGLRSPARDTLVSHATKQVGTGWGFGISEFIDQIGATLGPLIFTLFFLHLGSTEKTASDYQQGYSLLWFPMIMLMLVLFLTFYRYRAPVDLEASAGRKDPEGIPRIFWIYSFFTFFATAGFINFAIVGYHLKNNGIVSDAFIPLLYAAAMIVDAAAGLIVGKAYDRMKLKRRNVNAGLLVLLLVPVLSAVLLPLIFSQDTILVTAAVFLWGVVMGSHETIMKAAVADLTAVPKRGTGYGVFNVIYGAALFAGSVIAGHLYEISIPLMIAVLVCFEVMSIPFFLALKKEAGLRGG